MARDHTQVLFSMWTDEDFATLLLFDKLLYNVLLGQPAMNWAGVQPINFKRWRKAMRDGDQVPSETEVMVGMLRLEQRRYIFTDDDTGEVLARSSMRGAKVYQQPLVLLSALRSIAVVESPKIAAVLFEELRRIEIPEIKGDKPSSNKLRLNLKQAYVDAMAHCETLSKGSTKPFPKPFVEEFPEGLPRPAETEPSPKPSPKGLPKGTGVGVGVGDVLTTVGTQVGEVAEQTPRSADIDLAPEEDGPPPPTCPKHHNDINAPPCGACRGYRQRREKWESHTEDRLAQRRAMANELRAACTECMGHGWVLGDDGEPVEPARKCRHTKAREAIAHA